MRLQLNSQFGLYESGGKAFCDSLQVAETFEKRHAHVIRDIEQIGNVLTEDVDNLANPNLGSLKQENFISEKGIEPDIYKKNFIETSYADAQGKRRPRYLMTKDGFTLLVMGYSGKKAMGFKIVYIDRFNKMEEHIKMQKLIKEMQADPEWQEARQVGKLNRLRETEELKALVEYARASGSKNADTYYATYTTMVNRAVGIQSGQRGEVAAQVVQAVGFLENIVCSTIMEEIPKGTDYHEIYRICRNRVTSVAAMLSLPAVKQIGAEERKVNSHVSSKN